MSLNIQFFNYLSFQLRLDNRLKALVGDRLEGRIERRNRNNKLDF